MKYMASPILIHFNPPDLSDGYVGVMAVLNHTVLLMNPTFMDALVG